MASEERGGRGGRLITWVGWLGVVATTLGAIAGLIAIFFPQVRPPCIGSSKASFQNAPVFPGVPFRQHLVRQGTSPADAQAEPNLVGAEVRFTFETDGFRKKNLPVTYSLFTVAEDGSLGPVVATQDRALAMTIRPEDCSDQGSYDLWVQVPEGGKRYRILLELYRDKELHNRIDLFETEIFHG